MVINVLGLVPNTSCHHGEIIEMKFSIQCEVNNREMLETHCDTLRF